MIRTAYCSSVAFSLLVAAAPGQAPIGAKEDSVQQPSAHPSPQIETATFAVG